MGLILSFFSFYGFCFFFLWCLMMESDIYPGRGFHEVSYGVNAFCVKMYTSS